MFKVKVPVTVMARGMFRLDWLVNLRCVNGQITAVYRNVGCNSNDEFLIL